MSAADGVELTEQDFQFKRYDVTTLGSVTAIMATLKSLCGLYVLRFADGDAYVGQSVNVAQRFLAHRDRWEDIVSLDFAPWPLAKLDDDELRLITLIEATTGVRNKTGAGRPGGEQDVAVTVDQVRHAVLPWERGNRKTVITGEIDDRRQRFWDLSQHGDYPAIRSLVARYLDETVPDPANTQRYLWNVTALPSTAKSRTSRRLLTLNCGKLETLFVVERQLSETEYALHIAVNVAIPSGATDEDLTIDEDDAWAQRGGYKSQPVWTWRLTPEQFAAKLDSATFMELAYELNVRLMRSGASPYQQYHNVELASDLLNSAYLLH
jgi:hypothetical protein